MGKVIGGMLLLAASFLTLQGGPNVSALAQGKKPAAGVVEIGEGKDGKFRFFVRNAEGKLLAMSSPGGFASAKDAQKAIEDLKDVLAKAKVTMVEKKKAKAKG